MLCEWAGLRYAGGGVVPIVGCAGNVIVESKGSEVVARIEGKEPLRASSKDFSVKKPGIEFRVSGRDGEEVQFDNLRVWELN